MDKGLSDLIEELREYAAPRKGELAGMILEAANRLEKQAKVIRDCMAIREWSPGWMTKRGTEPGRGRLGRRCRIYMLRFWRGRVPHL